MYIPPQQLKILQAALALWRKVAVEGQTPPAEDFVAGLQLQAGLEHVHGWYPPQLNETRLAAHQANLTRLETKLLHEAEAANTRIKKWIRHGELPDDVGDKDAALDVAADKMDKACAEQLLGSPVFLGDNDLFYVINIQATIELCNPDFAEQTVEEYVEDLLDAPPELETSTTSLRSLVDGLRQAVKQHRETVERMFGPSASKSADEYLSQGDCPVKEGREMLVELSHKELATVLAALRYWQQDLAENQAQGEVPIAKEHFQEVQPLSVAEIDQLCERLNCG
jgi:hypothetical protein